jgi:integrase
MCRFRDYDGITRKVEHRAETGAKAERGLISKLQDRRNTSTADVHGDMRVSALASIWWGEFLDLDRASNTVTRYRDALDNHVLPGLGNLRVRECTVSALDRFLKAVRTNTGGPTAKVCKTVLSGILGVAARHGALDGNPLRDVAPIPSKKTEVRALTVTEVVALRAGLDQWQSTMPKTGRQRPQDLLDVVDLMLATGCRIGEALALRWSDVDLGEQPKVSINGTIVPGHGSGLKLQDHPKSSGSRQSFLLPQFAVNTLLRRQVEQVAGNPYDVIFPSATGTLRDPSNFRKQWRKARADIGFDWVTPHTFRKSVGTILANTEGLAAAQRQLGHSSDKVTSQHYVERAKLAPDMTSILEAFGVVKD